MVINSLFVAALLAVAASGQGLLLTGVGAGPPAAGGACGTGYLHCRQLTIDHTKVPNTDQSNFPVLLSATIVDWADSGHGGDVQNTVTQSGGQAITIPADWIISTAANCGSPITSWEFETYTNTSGAVNVWFKVTTVSHTSDTILYVCDDKASVSTQQGTVSSTWDSNYLIVWHLADGATNTTVVDSTSNANNGTNASNTSTKTVTGQIDGALTYAGTATEQTTLASATALNAYPITVELWCKYALSHSDVGGIFTKYTGNSLAGWSIHTNGGHTYAWYFKDSSNDVYPGGDGIDFGAGLNDSAWHHYAFVVDSGGGHIYLDGTVVGSATAWTGTAGATTSTELVRIADLNGLGGGFLSEANEVAQADEARLSQSARSADWVKTEYNNQNSPSTFITIGGRS